MLDTFMVGSHLIFIDWNGRIEAKETRKDALRHKKLLEAYLYSAKKKETE